MKSLKTIEREYLLHRLSLAKDLMHAIACGLEDSILHLNREIDRIDRILNGSFPYDEKIINVGISADDVERMIHPFPKIFTPGSKHSDSPAEPTPE